MVSPARVVVMVLPSGDGVASCESSSCGVNSH